MRTLSALCFILCAFTAFGQVTLSSLGINSKLESTNVSSNAMLGLEFTVQSVLNDHFIVNGEFSRVDNANFSINFNVQPTGVTKKPEGYLTFGANVGYRFLPHPRVGLDLLFGGYHYVLDERVGFPDANAEYGRSYRTDQSKGLGLNAGCRVNWNFTKFSSVNLGSGIQSTNGSNPYFQIGLELGLLR
jgi:hypothetical protein